MTTEDLNEKVFFGAVKCEEKYGFVFACKITDSSVGAGSLIKRFFILALGFFVSIIPLQSQKSIAKMDSATYANAIAEIHILKNTNNLIPLKNLASKHIGTYFHRGDYQAILFDESLYFHPVAELEWEISRSGVRHASLNQNSMDRSGFASPYGGSKSADMINAHLARDKESSIANDITIIGLDKESLVSANMLLELMSEKGTIVLLFDPEVIIAHPQLLEADVIVEAYGDGEVSRRLAVQMVFGGIKEGGDRGIRLAVGSADAMGMDIEYLGGKIDSIAAYAIATRACPGMQVLVARKGKVVFQRSYGYHTYDEVMPVKDDDIFDLASITKATSVLPALMQLYGQDKFDLGASLADYLPSFSHSNKGDLEWRQILAHNARLKAWIPYWRSTKKRNGKFKPRTFKNVSSDRFPTVITDSLFLHRNYKKKIYKAIRKSKLNEDPGYLYSGLSFYLLPEIVSNLTGGDFETYLKKEIYERIGAYTITYNPLRYFTKDMIIPTERDTFFRMTQIHGRVHDEGAAMMGGVSGNAGLFATADDLAKLAQLYLNRGVYGGETIIEPEVMDEFTRCQYCEEGNHRGLGFDKPAWGVDPNATSVSISKMASLSSFGHSGYTGTLMWIDPEEELVFIFLSNRVYQTRLNRKLYTENIRPAMHDAIYHSITD